MVNMAHTVPFSEEDKLRAVMTFLKVMNRTAGCTADELKRLLDPRIIDATLEKPC